MCAGSIPACAGEPGGFPAPENSGGVYPRLCGGTYEEFHRLRRLGGLSPPVRGNRELPGSPDRVRRSIPACAGEPATVMGVFRIPAVYPRLCGGTGQHRP